MNMPRNDDDRTAPSNARHVKGRADHASLRTRRQPTRARVAKCTGKYIPMARTNPRRQRVQKFPTQLCGSHGWTAWGCKAPSAETWRIRCDQGVHTQHSINTHLLRQKSVHWVAHAPKQAPTVAIIGKEVGVVAILQLRGDLVSSERNRLDASAQRKRTVPS